MGTEVMGTEPEKDAPALLSNAGEHPTLNEMMRRDPALLSETDRERSAELLRRDRAVFIKAEADRKRR